MTGHEMVGKERQDTARMEHATVKAVTEAGLIVHGCSGVTTARTAFGCLVAPQAGDHVLVSRDRDACFVLTVLERASSDKTIAVAGTLALSARSLTLHGRDDARLSSGDSTAVSGRSVGLVGEALTARGQQISVSGEQATGQFNSAKLVATTMESVVDRVVQYARQLVRKIEETEATSARTLIQTVRENYFSRSKRTSITARKDVQVDAERIHMG